MATMKMQTPTETQIHEPMSNKTLETLPLQHTERFEESAIPSAEPSDIATDDTKKEGEGEESKEMGSEKEKGEDSMPSAGAAASPVSDLDKKMRRAERFGITVQMSEEEKRNSRAERFGTVSSPHGSNASQKSEELKRKARAERFGLPSESLADEESKKKARLARFATVPKVDNLEEEKKKARAIRFSQPPSGASAQINGSSNSVTEEGN